MCITWIPLAECTVSMAYRLASRNLAVGMFDGAGGFIGIREKFGRRYLFTEYHWDTGEPFGTVRPMEALEPYSGALSEDDLGLFDWLDALEVRTGYRNPPSPNNMQIARNRWLASGKRG